MKRRTLLLPLIGLALLAGCATPPGAGPAFVSQNGLAGSYDIPLQSMDQRRFAGVVRQQYDFSCGSAALATLLRYHYAYKVGEDLAFRGMWAEGDRDQIRKVGFSLLDMKRWLTSRGVEAEGYRVSLDDIGKTGIPGIALIAIKNYRHFVVVKGVRGDEVLLGDPSLGLTTMPRAEFQAAWNGVYFVVTGDQQQARANFDRDDQWAAFARAPVGDRFSDPVSMQALLLTAPDRGDY